MNGIPERKWQASEGTRYANGETGGDNGQQQKNNLFIHGKKS
jgi:hypothetical protein